MAPLISTGVGDHRDRQIDRGAAEDEQADAPDANRLNDSVSKERAMELVAQSSIVTVIVGRGDSLQWERERRVGMEALHKVIAVFPPIKRDELVARWKILGASFNIQDHSIVGPLRGTFDDLKKPVLIVGESRRDTFYREAVLEGACRIFKTVRPVSMAS